MRPSTAIVLFADDSLAEARSKRILPELSLELNRQLLRYMTASALQKAQLTDLPILLVNRSQQEGNSFGSRLASAFNHAFEAGYDNVLMIGNDCLDLAVEDFNQAAEYLANSNCVLGPDLRGGTWLIGLTKQVFETLDFGQFNWQTSQVFSELIEALGGHNIKKLVEKRDVNARLDLKQYIHQLKKGASNQLIEFLIQLTSKDENSHLAIELRSITFVQHLQMRAPPVTLVA